MLKASDKNKKILGSVFLGLILSGIFFPFSETHAIVPVLDAAAVTELGLITGNTGSLVAKEYGLDTIAWAVAKGILKTLTTQIVNWIKTGDMRGSLVIENFLDQFMREMDNAAGLFLQRFFGPNSRLLGLLCEPFRLALPQLLNARRSGPSYEERARCKLSDIVNNVQNFQVNLYYKDFSQGGWNAWFASLDPSGSIVGQYLEGASEMDKQIGAAFLNSKTEVSTTGGGLLSWQECEPVTTDPAEEAAGISGEFYKNCKTQTPGGLVQDSLSNAFGSGIKQLEIADELNEILGAFFQVMIEQIISPIGGLTKTDINALDRDNPVQIPPPPTPVATRAIRITSPTDGVYVSGNIRVAAITNVNSGSSTSVQFTLNGSSFGAPISAIGGGVEITLNTATLPEGPHIITAILLDSNGQQIDQSDPVRINIDRIPPTVGTPTINGSPLNVINLRNISVEAADNGNEQAVTVEFLLGGRPIGQARYLTGQHRLQQWDSRNMPNGTYQLTAKVTDRAGLFTISSTAIIITINN